MDPTIQTTSPTKPPPDRSRLVVPGSAEDRLADIAKLRGELEENFHLYEEVRTLPAEDRDSLFKLLWEAQTGDPSALEAVYSLVYDEIPVGMEEFILSSKYLGLKGLINKEKLDLLVQFAQPHVRKFWCAAGSGGGKSFMVSIAMAYMAYSLVCLKRPDLFYMLGPGSRIAIINLSVSKEQARDVIFAEFLARVSGSPWFVGRYRSWTAKARFPKRIYALSGGSAAISYFGYHTIFGSLDEASFLMDRQDRSMAEELAEALLKSLNTRFPRSYKLFVISTLRSADDYLINQIERLKESGVRIL